MFTVLDQNVTTSMHIAKTYKTLNSMIEIYFFFIFKINKVWHVFLSKTGTSISFRCGKKNPKVNENIFCKSKNHLYCITCTIFGKEYIGQTGTQLTIRMRVHHQQINNPSAKPPIAVNILTQVQININKYSHSRNLKLIPPP